jgi:hypothetical protein
MCEYIEGGNIQVRNIKITMMRQAGHIKHMMKARNANEILVYIHEGKTPLGRPKRRW